MTLKCWIHFNRCSVCCQQFTLYITKRRAMCGSQKLSILGPDAGWCELCIIPLQHWIELRSYFRRPTFKNQNNLHMFIAALWRKCVVKNNSKWGPASLRLTRCLLQLKYLKFTAKFVFSRELCYIHNEICTWLGK